MNGECPRAVELEAWQRLGSRAALPEALERHLSDCAPCRARVVEIRALRSLFASLPPLEIEQRRLEEMQFLLMAEARRQPPRRLPPSLESSSYLRWREWQPRLGYVWAIVLSVSAASAVSSLRSHRDQAIASTEGPAHRAPMSESRLQVEPSTALPVFEPTSTEQPKATPSARSRRLPTRAPEARVTEPAPSTSDVHFRRAHALLRRGRAQEAVSAFDRLADDGSLDAARRADALFWAARAARASGDATGARSRAERYLQAYPDGWYAAGATALR
jgi:TolA-binding protein